MDRDERRWLLALVRETLGRRPPRPEALAKLRRGEIPDDLERDHDDDR